MGGALIGSVSYSGRAAGAPQDQAIEGCRRSEVYLTGQNRLLGQPEYQDLDRAREVLGALDEEVISGLPAKLDPNSPVQILVGPENVAKELKDTAKTLGLAV